MTFLIIGLVVSVVALAILLWYEKKETGDCSMSSFTILFSCWALASLASLVEYDTPSALDVYRGKTTLEITYRDSVAIDSTVIYKVR
jgi:hypothetical protein